MTFNIRSLLGSSIVKSVYPYLIILAVFAIKNHQVNNRPLQIKKDAVLYNEIAISLAEGKSTIDNPISSSHGLDIGAVIMPGYPFVVSLIYRIFGVNTMAVKLFQTLMLFIAVLLFYKLLVNILHPFVALMGTIWLVAYNPFIRTASSLYLECATISALILTLWFAYRFLQRQNVFETTLFSVAFAILISFNNRFIFHFVICCLVWFIMVATQPVFKFKYIILSGTIVLLFLLPWHIRQYNVYNKVVIFTPFGSAHAKSEQGKSDVEFDSYEQALSQFLSDANNMKDSLLIQAEFNQNVYNNIVQNQKTKGFGAFTDRAFGFFNLYYKHYHVGFGHDTRFDNPNINSKQLFIGWSYVFVLLIFILLLHWLSINLSLQPIIKYLLFTLLILFCIPAMYKSTDIINFGIIVVFLTPGIYQAIKLKQKFILFLVVLLTAHIVLHAYTHYITRYRLTILPAIFLIALYGINSIKQLIPLKLKQ